ncbi:CAP domain-containing protein [Flavobacterium solisilvae]|uniref:CAP domain-containing protein n=1 Tax=Flavobacterium solisilvae TaxID=1852019 RepID=A0ABX1QYV2_9FLAO|nr:CAP domain-containing protein [Flavobacterium solisilvae]NMH26369.1 CAP domain-containing protein [Flavobacterium solisilvae]
MKTKMFRALLLLAIVFTTVSCSSDESETATKEAVVTNYNYNEVELRLVQLINNHRKNLGLNELQVINHISYKSEGHNEYMIEKQTISHDGFQQRSQNIINTLGAEKVAENVAYNYITAESVVAAWLNSPGHRQNIEGDFTHFGISASTDSKTGKRYYTNIFMKEK